MFCYLSPEGCRFECTSTLCRIGIQVLYSGVLWPHPARVTCFHPHLGAIEAEIFVFKFLPWPGFEPRTSQSNGRERYHSTTTHPHCVATLDNVLTIFIPAISIAPLQVLYYSEALPTTARILYRSFTPKRTGNCR